VVKKPTWHKGKTNIKHTLLLILALLLMLDIAEDGFLGKATFELPPAAAKTSVSAPHHISSGQVDCRHKVPPPNLCDPPGQANYQPVSFRVQPTLKIIDYRNNGSSGGIPLEGAFPLAAFPLAPKIS
jgi:hypothetical protein